MSNQLSIPPHACVVLIGASGSGKSTWAQAHFTSTQILSSDSIRAMLADDENEQGVSREAFEILYKILYIRLKRGLLTVVDATNVTQRSRTALTDAAKDSGRQIVAIIMNVPLYTCLDRNALRNRVVPEDVICKQYSEFVKSLASLPLAYDQVYYIDPLSVVTRYK